uniref:ISL LIM homeobox 2 n=1 Tax=Panthera tigris altaica TaxID=74533 RepID=A0A8C9JRD0_PANTA
MVDIIFHYPFLGAMGDHSKSKECVDGNAGTSPFSIDAPPCLKCPECSQYLDETCTCFVRDGKTYCKRDYVRMKLVFSAPDFGSQRYSLLCVTGFRLPAAGVRRYLPGVESSQSQPRMLAAAGGGPSLTSCPPVLADPASGRQPSLRPHVHKQTEKTTRVRTVLNEKQLHTLRTCYAANPRPDALMKEQLVEMTGLSPRVIRVWFQNKRCKDKKKSILMKQLQQQQHNDKTSLQGLTGTPLVAGSPIRHESAVQGSAVEVQTYQPPWKALSEFALQSDLDQPAFQQLVSFSESGSLGNSSGSDVTSLSSQLPDTPNSMVPSPVET